MSYAPQQWGPRTGGSPVPKAPSRRRGCLIALMAVVGLMGLPLLLYISQSPSVGIVGAIFVGACIIFFANALILRPSRTRKLLDKGRRQLQGWHEGQPQLAVARAPDPLVAARDLTYSRGGGAFLGITPDFREWATASAEQAVLVLGPPRAGKTASVIIPSILNAAGAVVSTATTRDVMEATHRSRSRYGRVWLFDPSGQEPVPDGVLPLHWTPVWPSRDWDTARLTAEAMVNAAALVSGSENAYRSEMSKALLGSMLHAAALRDGSISQARHWILSEDYASPRAVLVRRGALLAVEDLDRVANTEDRERDSVVNATATVLRAYGSEAVMRRIGQPNFDAGRFVDSSDTVYITVHAQQQDMYAPLVVGLLEDVRTAVYQRARRESVVTRHDESRRPPMLWALDEIANIAPLKSLPAVVSEGGGRGLQVMACFQDLTQASLRWGKAADGFLTLFGTKVIFPGIGDRGTLGALSTMVGDWDRPYAIIGTSYGQSVGHGLFPKRTNSFGASNTYTTAREVLLSASEIANIPEGHALVVRSGRWGLVEHTPYYSALPWTEVIARSPKEVIPRGGPDVLALGSAVQDAAVQDAAVQDAVVQDAVVQDAPADGVTEPIRPTDAV